MNKEVDIDFPEFMKSKSMQYRKPIKVEIDGEALFYCIDYFFEKHKSKFIIASLIYFTSHVISIFTR